MATTIKLKNGSGAPLASDLVQGEPAFDLTNKRLYTEDSGGTVIEVGTTPTSLTTTGTVTFGSLSDGAITITAFVDEDNMVSDSATLVPTQQSVKAYVDSQVTAQDLDFQGDSGGALSIDLDSETLTIAGGTGIDTTGATNTLTVAIDSTVTTLTGTQTLTNKTLTTPVISTISNTGTLTLPTSTDTLVGRATTDTLTNKTLTSPVINTGVSGTAVLDDDTFATASATTLATSESIKAYVDAQVDTADQLSELSDVNITTPADGALLFYDTGTTKWIDNVVSGDITIADTGVAAISSGVIVNADVNASAAISVSKTALVDGTGLTLTGDTLSVDASQTQITAVGTIGTGTWQGTAIADAYVADNLTISGGTVDNTVIGGTTAAAGTFTTFTSTGIDDNATSTAITIDSSQNVTVNGNLSATKLTALNGTLELDDNGTHNGIINVPASLFINIDSDGTNTGEDFVIAKDRTSTSGGTELFRVQEDGNVGIGTASPAQALDVVGTIKGDSTFLLSNATTSSFLQVSTNILQFGTSSSDPVAFYANNAERMRIDSSGQVGIGTDSPNEKLNVSGNIRVTSGFVSFSGSISTPSEAAALYRPADNTIAMSTANTERMRIDSSGNVGIGTASPLRNLQIGDHSGAQQALSIQASTTGKSDIFLGDGTGASEYAGLVRYDHASDFMAFWTSSSERMRITSSGNVGIGTTGPASKLEVSGTGTGAWITLDRQDSGTNLVDFTQSGTRLGYIGYIVNDLILNNATASNTIFNTNNTERMRIDSSGNVGIGTTDIGAKLSVRSAASSSITNVLDVGNAQNAAGTGHGAMIRLHCTTDENRGVAIASSSNTNYATDNDMLFYTSTSSTMYERMRISSSGNLLVGTTSSVSNGSEGIELRGDFGYFKTARNTAGSAGHWLLYNSNGNVGSVTTSGSATQYNTSSDQRLKENIVDAPAGNIDAVRVRSFDWKADGSHQTYGMVAQELVDVAPEAVTQGETDDDMWAVDYSKLVPMMIKEIQDLRARVAQLEGA